MKKLRNIMFTFVAVLSLFLMNASGVKAEWRQDSNGWWYAYSTTEYYKECWQIINHHKYYFNPDGYALTNWHVIDGKDYYFEPRAGHPLECAMYVAPEGEQYIGEF